MHCKQLQDSDFQLYSEWLSERSHASLWQSLEWKAYQEALGREVRVYAAINDAEAIEATALVVIDRTAGGYCTWDIPRGPLWKQDCDEQARELLNHIVLEAKEDRCISVYYSPMAKIQNSEFRIQNSDRHEQPEATRLIDLTPSDDDILAQMKPKGRYNIKVAQKHNVQVEQSNAIGAYYRLATETGSRDGFGIPTAKQLEHFLDDIPGAFLLLATHSSDPNPIAGLLGVVWGSQAIYYYGASAYAHRALMAPYALQWSAIQYAKTQGCTQYDLLGVAPPEAENHPWAGVSSFKEKFGGEVVIYPPEQEIVLRPWIKRLLNWKRKLVK